MFSVLVGDRVVYVGTMWQCCGYMSCLREPAILLDQWGEPAEPQELGYSA